MLQVTHWVETVVSKYCLQTAKNKNENTHLRLDLDSAIKKSLFQIRSDMNCYGRIRIRIKLSTTPYGACSFAYWISFLCRIFRFLRPGVVSYLFFTKKKNASFR
jgi:hypothetical protein